jgi:hypothetical protein
MNELIGTIGLIVAVVSILLSTAVSIIVTDASASRDRPSQGRAPISVPTAVVVQDGADASQVIVSDRVHTEFATGEFGHGGWGYDTSVMFDDEADDTPTEHHP